MIYFLDNNLKLKKIVTRKNVISAKHEYEGNNLIINNLEIPLDYGEKFIDDVDYFGYYFDDDFYVHKIKRIEEDMVEDIMLVNGRHIFFEDMLFGKLIKDVRPQNRDAAYILKNTVDTHTRWNTTLVDTTGTVTTNFYWQVPYEAVEYVVNNFRLEYIPKLEFNGQEITSFNLEAGRDMSSQKPIRVPFGSRILKLIGEYDYSEVITKLVVHGKGEEVGDGYGRRIDISSVNFSRNGVVSPVGDVYLENPDITALYGNDGGTPRYARVTFDDITDPRELAEAGYEYYMENCRPKMLYQADVSDIGPVKMFDRVHIVHHEYNIYLQAKVSKLVVDLLYPEDAEIEIGDFEHFNETVSQKSSRAERKRYLEDLDSAIEQARLEFDRDFDAKTGQMIDDWNQELIDTEAAIAADMVKMKSDFDREVSEFQSEFKKDVTDARNYAEQQAQAKAEQVQNNLDAMTSSHQGMIDQLKSNVLDLDDFRKGINTSVTNLLSDVDDIDAFIGDKTKTLAQQFADVSDRFTGIQSDLSNVFRDLSTTRENLQKQLDEARKVFDDLEIGGRNLLLNSENLIFIRRTGQTVEIIPEYMDITKPIKMTNGTNASYFNPIERYSEDYIEGQEYTWSFFINYKGVKGSHPQIYVGDGTSYRDMEGTPLENKWVKMTYTFKAKGSRKSNRLHLNLLGYEEIYLAKFKLEKGTVATDWTPAPEDTEQKITTLNQQIEFIDGQLSAKLEQTDIQPLRDTITQHRTELHTNAQNIELLQSKTSLIDGDITQWRNETQSNAEQIRTMLTKQSDHDGDISRLSSDLSLTADRMNATLNKVETIERDITAIDGTVQETSERLTTYQGELQLTANKLETTFSKATENENAIGSLQQTATDLQTNFTNFKSDTEREMSTFRQTAASLESNFASYKTETDGNLQQVSTNLSTLEQRVNGFSTTVSGVYDYVDTIEGQREEWQKTMTTRWEQTEDSLTSLVTLNDISRVNPNLIPFNDVGVKTSADQWQNYVSGSYSPDSYGRLNVYNSNTNSNINAITSKPFRVFAGQTYTLSVRTITSQSWNTQPDFRYTYIMRFSGGNIGLGTPSEYVELNSTTRRNIWHWTAEKTEDIYIMFGTYKHDQTKTSRFAFNEPKFEVGSNKTTYIKAFSNIEQLANQLSIRVAELSSVDGSELVTQSELKLLSNSIEAVVNQSDGFEERISILRQDYESISSTVMDKPWLSDIADINANLIPFADTSYEDNLQYWRGYQTASSYMDIYGEFHYTNYSAGNNTVIGVRSQKFDVIAGQEYTFSVITRTSSNWGTTRFFRYTYLIRDSGSNTFLDSPVNDEYIDASRYRKTWKFTAERNETLHILLGTYTTGGDVARFSFREPKLEQGSTRTPFMNSLSHVEQLANKINLRVADISGGKVLTQSDIVIEPSYIQLGSQRFGDQQLASLLRVGGSSIDAITQNLNLTGNLNVKGQIETIAMSAIRGEFASLFASQVKANTIDVDYIQGKNAWFMSQYILNANIERLTAQHVFINEAKIISLDAVEANISSIVTRKLASNIITSAHLNVDNALINKMFATSALISNLTSKTAFIRDIQGITITANQLNVQTLQSKLGSVEGGLTIYGPDGRQLMNNSMLRASFDVQIQDAWARNEVTFWGMDYYTGSDNWQMIKYFYTEHKGSQLLVSWAVGLQSGASASEYTEVRTRGFGANNPIGTYPARLFSKTSGTEYHNQIINLGVPDYNTIQGYLEFRRSPTGTSAQNTVTARILRVSLIN